MTDELIARLSADLEPVRPMALHRVLLGALLLSCVVALIGMLMLLGMRPDLAVATTTTTYWTKFAYTLALALLGLAATLVLARPDGQTRWHWLAGLGLLGAVLLLAVMQLTRAEDMMPLVIGSSILRCLTYVPLFSLPMLLGALIALRRLAPSSPTLAGLAAGIMAGGAGAWVYAFTCGETGIMFLALWYTLAVALVGALGAMLGRLLLRW